MFVVAYKGPSCYGPFCYLLNTVSLPSLFERAFVRLVIFIFLPMITSLGIPCGTFVPTITPWSVQKIKAKFYLVFLILGVFSLLLVITAKGILVCYIYRPTSRRRKYVRMTKPGDTVSSLSLFM